MPGPERHRRVNLKFFNTPARKPKPRMVSATGNGRAPELVFIDTTLSDFQNAAPKVIPDLNVRPWSLRRDALRDVIGDTFVRRELIVHANESFWDKFIECQKDRLVDVFNYLGRNEMFLWDDIKFILLEVVNIMENKKYQLDQLDSFQRARVGCLPNAFGPIPMRNRASIALTYPILVEIYGVRYVELRPSDPPYIWHSIRFLDEVKTLPEAILCKMFNDASSRKVVMWEDIVMFQTEIVYAYLANKWGTQDLHQSTVLAVRARPGYNEIIGVLDHRRRAEYVQTTIPLPPNDIMEESGLAKNVPMKYLQQPALEVGRLVDLTTALPVDDPAEQIQNIAPYAHEIIELPAIPPYIPTMEPLYTQDELDISTYLSGYLV